MGMGFAPTWLRQVSPLLHKTTLTTEGKGGEEGEGIEGVERRGEEAFLVMWPRRLSALNPPLLTHYNEFNPT